MRRQGLVLAGAAGWVAWGHVRLVGRLGCDLASRTTGPRDCDGPTDEWWELLALLAADLAKEL